MDLTEKVGMAFWRRLLAHDRASALLKLPEALAESERRIAQLRGQRGAVEGGTEVARGLTVAAESGDDSGGVRALTWEQDRLMTQGRPGLIRELLEVGALAPDEAIKLEGLPLASCGSTITTSEDLIELGVRLKGSAVQTVDGWRRALKEFTGWLGHDHLQLTTRQVAADFRDHLLRRGLKVSTVQTRLNYLTGLYTTAVEEERFTVNPFKGVGKRLKTEAKPPRQQLDIEAIPIHKLKPKHQDLFRVLLYTGCRLAEGAGLELSDIDLDSGVIRISPKADRSIKTPDSPREVPIHTKLRPTLEKLIAAEDRWPWRELYSPKTTRWAENHGWGKLLGGVTPHKLRHHAVSCMRSNGFAETVIGRVVGHKVPGTTASYGTVSDELLRAAVESIR
ncbi:tyrosine-type recombinase/integrase [Synechococcus sp. BA-132 BA5]|uniref:tyrosine-type recombinase/integrase n=1 Tax=Synechococcus sp. BA-132 BA5 TaxID=3110252 RepID=UPI002B20894C|nr:tyrosine-type recombinase/integrase [Synechococcus sp. BA-132 BA5]MEA5416708.1 tyrosine-type recombinase/integrase [Synechococcus sp. BA-132 BA5]